MAMLKPEHRLLSVLAKSLTSLGKERITEEEIRAPVLVFPIFLFFVIYFRTNLRGSRVKSVREKLIES